jgi:prepilin-type N-terminal cleavage/methylation domain-containing protein
VAKRRFGEAARRREERPSLLRVPVLGRESSSAGFTLIELLIVVAVMPLVVGALTVGILSVFTLQNSVSNRLTDSGDAQVVSANLQGDVQSASTITTARSPNSAPAPCGSGFQVLGLQVGTGDQISYNTSANPGGGSATLTRYVCTGGTQKSLVLAHDMPSSVVQPGGSPVTIACSYPSTAPACAPEDGLPPSGVQCVQPTPAVPLPPGVCAYTQDWVSTLGVTTVTFNTTTPKNYNYQLTAVPAAGSNTASPPPPPSTPNGIGFATPGTGNPLLGFVDFAPWAALHSAPPANSHCQSGQLYMSAGVTNTAFTLSFCMSVTSSQFNANCGQGCAGTPGQSISGYVTNLGNQNPLCSPNLQGWDDIAAVPMPTYTCAPTSQAFLGNNGFYTGVLQDKSPPGDPALYTVAQSSSAVVSFTNIQLLTGNGAVVTNWQLVTGDAESTDTNESITWHSDQKLSLLPNSANSPVGNACNSFGQYAPPAYNPNNLTGVGTTTVACSSTVSEDHTGTVMLQATTPSTLTVTLYAGGLQALFLGVLLP